MKNWVKNRWWDSALKLLVLLIIVHIIVIIIGAFTGPFVGIFGWSVLWNHLTNVTFWNYFVAIGLGIILYFIIYLYFSNNDEQVAVIKQAK